MPEMKTKYFAICLSMSIILALSLVSAEISVSGFNSVITDSSNNQTRHSLYIILDDTSINEVAKQTSTNVTIYVNHYLNYTFSNNATLITCHYNSIQTMNEYDINGNFNSSSVETRSYDYNYSATSVISYSLKEKDTLQANLDCFYDTAVDNSIFILQSESIIGLGVNTHSYACDKCSRGSFEEAVTAYLDAQKSTQNQIGFYQSTAGLTDKVTEFWLAVYWILRISAYILLVFLIFGIALALYKFVQNLRKA